MESEFGRYLERHLKKSRVDVARRNCLPPTPLPSHSEMRQRGATFFFGKYSVKRAGPCLCNIASVTVTVTVPVPTWSEAEVPTGCEQVEAPANRSIEHPSSLLDAAVISDLKRSQYDETSVSFKPERSSQSSIRDACHRRCARSWSCGARPWPEPLGDFLPAQSQSDLLHFQ